jgi:glutamate-1-semialdehyde 2,1-aminomutase
MLALRAARAFTGRGTIATFAGYYLVHDYAAASRRPGCSSGRHAVSGCRRETIVVAPFNSIEATRAALEPRLADLAAVSIEPVLGSGGVLPATGEFLAFLRELTREAGALLIFDEVISFRVGYHGAQGRLGVTPDLRHWEDHRRRPTGRRVRWPPRRHGALRPARRLRSWRHVQREPAHDGSWAGR